MPTIITHDNSVITTGPNVDAFKGNSALATDSLTVNTDGFLIASGAGADGVVLNPGPVWKVTVNGSVISHQAIGMVLVGGGVDKSSAITIGAEGSVSGATAGLMLSDNATIVNAGTIASIGNAIAFDGGGVRTITNSGLISGGASAIVDLDGVSIDKVTNSGIIDGLINLGGGADTLTNSGAIENNVFTSIGDDTVTNTGKIKGTVNLGSGSNKLTSSGSLGGLVSGNGTDTITNSGIIGGTVNLGDGANSLKNSGTIDGYTSGVDADTVTNSGTVLGSVFLGNGPNSLTNSGTIGGNINGGADADNVKNTGIVSGFIDLGLGDDIFTGGAKAEVLRDNGGSDSAKLGAGDDSYRATRPDQAIDGTDTIDGSTGIDTYDARFAEANVFINIDKVAHDFSPFQPGTNVVAANTATGTDIAGTLKDTILGFENVIAGSGNDVVHGSAAANVLEGRDGADFLGGYAGNDRLLGGAGIDTLYGGLGKDTLTGGAGTDFFRFVSTGESTVGKGNRDVITDFTADDFIELSFIDADTTKGSAANDVFRFIGTNVTFSGAAGELRAYWTAEGQIVEGDVNGDKKADFAIEILDPGHALVLSAADFVL